MPVSLLRGHWSGIPSSLGGDVSYPSDHDEVTMMCVRLSSSLDYLLAPPPTHLTSHLHRRRPDFSIEPTMRLYKMKPESAFEAVSTGNWERKNALEIAFNPVLHGLELNLLSFVFVRARRRFRLWFQTSVRLRIHVANHYDQ